MTMVLRSSERDVTSTSVMKIDALDVKSGVGCKNESEGRDPQRTSKRRLGGGSSQERASISRENSQSSSSTMVPVYRPGSMRSRSDTRLNRSQRRNKRSVRKNQRSADECSSSDDHTERTKKLLAAAASSSSLTTATCDEVGLMTSQDAGLCSSEEECHRLIHSFCVVGPSGVLARCKKRKKTSRGGHKSSASVTSASSVDELSSAASVVSSAGASDKLAFQDLSKLESPSDISLSAAVIDEFSFRGTRVDQSVDEAAYVPLPCNVPNNLVKFVFPDGCYPSMEEQPATFFTFAMPLEGETGAKVDGVPEKVVGAGGTMYGAALCIHDYAVDMGSMLAIVKRSRYSGSLPLWMTRLNTDKLFLPRCLVLLSRHPFYDVWRRVLRQIYRISLVEAPLPIERYISNLVCSIPLPPRGQVQVEFGFTDEEPIVVARPPRNRLPLSDFSYRPLFASLSVGNIMVIFGLLLQETRVVICTKHYALLGPVIEALLSFLFPFVWQGLCVPILPFSMLALLDSKAPYLVGVHSRYLAKYKGKKRPSGVVFVDLDEDIVHLGVEGARTCRRTPCLPEKDAMKLRSRLEKYGGFVYLDQEGKSGGRITLGVRGGYMDNSYRELYAAETKSERALQVPGDGDEIENERERILGESDLAFPENEHKSSDEGEGMVVGGKELKPKEARWKVQGMRVQGSAESVFCLVDRAGEEADGFSVGEIRNAFLRFFIAIFHNYSQYISPTDDADFFLQEKFLEAECSEMKPESRAFVEAFTSSLMFAQFIEERIETPSHPEIRLFDESIVAKKNSTVKAKYRMPTPFLSDRSQVATECYTPSPPCYRGLHEDGRSYHHVVFPKLHGPLFGRTRFPKRFHEEETPRRSLSASHWIENHQSDCRRGKYKASKKGSKRSFVGKKNSLFVDGEEGVDVEKLVKIQLAVRCFLYARRFQRLKKSVLAVQSRLRMRPDRKVYQKLHNAVTTIQATRKMYPVRSQYLVQRHAAVLMQCHVRGHMTRYLVRKFKLYTKAAWTIQRAIRPRWTTFSSAKRQRAAVTLQSFVRLWFARKQFLRERTAAMTVQAVARGRKARFIFELIRDLVTTAQTRMRGYLARKKFAEIRTHLNVRYRLLILELWKRTFTPLTYRSLFWTSIAKRSALDLGIHVEEMLKLWSQLGLLDGGYNRPRGKGKEVIVIDGVEVPSTPVTRLYSLCNSRLQMARGSGSRNRNTNTPVPLFPAEIAAAREEGKGRAAAPHPLLVALDNLGSERYHLYEKLGSKAHKGLKEECFRIFCPAGQEKQRKKKVVESLWESSDFVRYSAKIVLLLQCEPKQLPKPRNRRKLCCDDGSAASFASFNSFTSWASGETAMFAHQKQEHRMNRILSPAVRSFASVRLRRKTRHRKTVQSPAFLRQRAAITQNMRGTWRRNRFVICRRFVSYGRWYARGENLRSFQ